MQDLTSPTWSSLCDTLESRNEEGTLTANILFSEQLPGIDDMGEFSRVLCLVKGKMRGGDGLAYINLEEVRLNEGNNYTATAPLGKIATSENGWREVGLDTSRVRYTIGEEAITIRRADSLTAPGDYVSLFAILGDNWIELFLSHIQITTELRVTHSGVPDARHGETITVNLTPNAHNSLYSPQYLYVFGSRAWVLEGVNNSLITATPLQGTGQPNTWNSTMITLNKAAALTVTERITTQFRILAGDHWVDVVVNINPQITGRFVDGSEPIYICI